MKGKKLQFPQHLQIKPTKSVVRAALFSILGDFVVGSTLMDCFAGTGSIGFESLSRGAKSVTFLEKNYECFQHLQQKIVDFSLQESAVILCKDAIEAFRHEKVVEKQYHWAYLDPPYGSSLSEEVVMLCLENNLFADGGIVVCEKRRKEHCLESIGQFLLWKSRSYGCTRLDFYQLKK